MTAYYRRMRIGARAGAAATAVSALLALSACGSDSSTTATDPGGSSSATPSASPTGPSQAGSTPTGPTCATVWRDGKALDTAYRGCASGRGWVKAQVYECSDGHRMVTYAHAFYAQPGRRITRSDTTLVKDHAFRHLMAVCGA